MKRNVFWGYVFATTFFALVIACAFICEYRNLQNRKENEISMNALSNEKKKEPIETTSEMIKHHEECKAELSNNCENPQDNSKTLGDGLPASIFINKKEFIDSTSGENHTIDDFYINHISEYGDAVWKEYIVIDFDYDSIDEMVVGVTDVYDMNYMYVIFHEFDNQIYAYTLTQWDLLSIYSDSTIIKSEGASASIAIHYRISKFNKDGYETEILAYGNGLSNIFRIGNEEVPADDYWDYITSLHSERDELEFVHF